MGDVYWSSKRVWTTLYCKVYFMVIYKMTHLKNLVITISFYISLLLYPVLVVLVFLPKSWIILDNLEFLVKIVDFLFLLPRYWIFLVLLPRTPRNFLDFFPRSWEIFQSLAYLAKYNCLDLGKISQKSKKFFGKKTKTASSG